MNFTLEMLLRIALLALIILVLPGLPWPDIEPYLGYFQQLFNLLYFLNPMMNIDLLFILGKAIMLIDMLLIVRTLIIAMIHFVTTGSFQTTINKPVGEGGIGGGETGI